MVYLHGFASSPQSMKAQFFRRRFESCGFTVEIPELDEGNFSGLTITGQLKVIERAVADRPAILMGSSLGGYLAALFASRSTAIWKLILMAPAFEFPRRWRERYSPEEMERWQQLGYTEVFHYGYREERALGYQLVVDSLQYEDDPDFGQPALIFHGIHDETVPVEISKAYAARHDDVTLRLLDSGHELTDRVEEMWTQTAAYLDL
ncbi:MAG TPA: YqiA/YcfP family alpha/beta fold hydrolase [Bryobacteraceae bacterium]|nr:YqiA/YcfP family alpha/beta fold hydrolase [Bryobacteraceae bacterium]